VLDLEDAMRNYLLLRMIVRGFT